MEKLRKGMNVNKKTTKEGKHPEIEQELEKFVDRANEAGAVVQRQVIKEKAIQIAAEKGIAGFKASNGWIGNFEKRKSIGHVTIHGDAASVSEITVSAWKEKLPCLLTGYSADDIFNIDECGLFYRLLPSKTLLKKGSKCKKGKEAKIRVTLLLGANMSGTEKIDPLMIGRSANPHCFQSFRKGKKPLPMKYKANPKAWMNGDLFSKYMEAWNEKMKERGRNILVFLDNCSAHPADKKFSNIRLSFLPANTTSHLQPMDQGVIRSFKSHYRRRLIQYIIRAIETDNKTADSVKVNLLQVMHWSLSAWSSVTQKTVRNCFRKAGFVENDSETEEEDDDVSDLMPALLSNEVISFADYVSVDDCLLVNDPESAETSIHMPVEESEEDEEEEEEVVIPPSKADALFALNTLISYNEFDQLVPQSVIDKMERSLVQRIILSKKQTKITDFFASHP